jgi:hypothetical protein
LEKVMGQHQEDKGQRPAVPPIKKPK